ncbi:unnamed protein product [Calypogeia fissa]
MACARDIYTTYTVYIVLFGGGPFKPQQRERPTETERTTIVTNDPCPDFSKPARRERLHRMWVVKVQFGSNLCSRHRTAVCWNDLTDDV